MTLLVIFSALIIAVTAAIVLPLRHKKIYAAAIMLLLPVLAFGLYIMLGHPGLPGKPFADRSQDPEFIMAAAVKDIQLKLKTSPSLEGYKNLAEALYLLQRYAEATEAYKKAIALGDKSAETLAEMAETVVLANGGTVVPEALRDFNKALKRDPKEGRARFYIALSKAQAGDFRTAVAIWKGLQIDLPPDAPWRAIIDQRIQTYARQGGFDPVTIEAADP